jgi:hypothetical protein
MFLSYLSQNTYKILISTMQNFNIVLNVTVPLLLNMVGDITL